MDRSLFALLNLGLLFGTAYIGFRMYIGSNPDVSQVGGSRLLGPAARGWYFTNLDPFDDLLARWGVSPNAITWAQLGVSFLCAFAYGAGLIYAAGFLLLASGTLDILDGRLARRTGGDSDAGAYLDSVVDRYSEFVVYFGLIVYFGSGWLVWAVLLALLGGVMVSYTRARAEALGQECKIGFLQRPERFVILGFGSVFSSILTHVVGGDQVLLQLVVLLLAVFANITALQRFAYVRRALLEKQSNG